MIKYSRQREAILKDLQSRRDHPTADMVYESVRKEYPNISLGTVYRNLAFLTESGQVLKITTPAGADHFDGFISPHNHFIWWKIWIIFPVTALSRKHPQILMVKSRIVSCSSMASATIAYKILLPWLQCIEIVCA